MTTYFTITSVAFLVLILIILFGILADGDWSLLSIIIGCSIIWFVISFLPSVIHTKKVVVSDAPKKEYMVKEISKYEIYLITNLGDESPEVKKFTNAYVIDKIKAGEYVVKKHVGYNIWGDTTTTEYYILTTKK